MKRGEIWWVDFEPALGSEIKKVRPAVIVSNDAANANAPRVQVVPLSSSVEKLFAFESHVRVRGKPSKAMADQIMTADKRRLKTRIGKTSTPEMQDLERAMRVQLALV